MRNYALTINCEFLNEAGILVNHTVKAVAHAQPHIADKYMFVAPQHFKPIVIRIMHIDKTGRRKPGIELHCDGEEVDETDDIKETFDNTTFLID